MRQRTQFLPIEDARAGMLLAEGVKDAYQRVLLPAGIELTEEHLQQLMARRVEFIHISFDDTRSDEQVATDAAASAHQVLEIFADADLSQPTMAALFNQVLLYRSA